MHPVQGLIAQPKHAKPSPLAVPNEAAGCLIRFCRLLHGAHTEQDPAQRKHSLWTGSCSVRLGTTET